MANIKFSAFTQKVAQADVDFLVGYTGADNVRITPAALGDGIYLPLGGGTMTGTTNHGDNVYSQWGTGTDFWMVHNGANTLFQNETGDLQITNNANDKDIIFKCDDGAGGTTEYFRVDGGDEQVVFSKDSNHLDNVSAYFGTNQDLRIHHNGSHSFIANNQGGDLRIIQNIDDGDIIFQSDDGAGGITTYFKLDGSEGNTRVDKDFFFVDNAKAKFGSSGDLEIYHDGGNSYINEVGTGNMYIQADTQIRLGSITGTEKYARFNLNGLVELFYDNVSVIETTATGIEVTDEVSIGTSIIHTGDTDTKISFGTDEIVLTTAGVDRMTVVSNGNIGIGNNNPNQSGLGIDHTVVTIGTATGMGMMELTGTRTSDADLGRIAWLNAATRRSEIVVSRIDENTSTKMAFSTSNAGSMGTRMTIAKDGDVGIGTTTPLFKLHTYRDDATAIPSVTIEQDGTGDASIHFLLSGIVGWSAGLDNSDGDKFKIHNSQGFSGSFFTIDGSGDVGIGTDTPTAALQVVGLVEYADNAAALLAGLTAGAFYRTGDLLKVVH
jgi:hypothetical protein